MNTKHPLTLELEERPSYSPHRIMLRAVWPREGYSFDPKTTLYHIQEQKTGARRGESPRWLGKFREEEEAPMREIVRRWNAYPRLVEAARSAAGLNGSLSQNAAVNGGLIALLRDLGEE